MATCFHIDNKQAARKLKVALARDVLVHVFAQNHIGVTLDRSLTYKKHTENVREKVKSRCNIISKLAGTDWRAPAPVLRTSAIAVVYSVAEYCVPVWGRCALVQHVDTQLNIAMRTVSGALRPTNINWQPVLSIIEPPHIRRDRATLQEYMKAHQLTDCVPIKEIPEYAIKILQRVQNLAARVVTRSSKYSSITPALKKLHWLPVKYRIIFKVVLLTFKALHGMAPNYLKTLLQSYMPSRSQISDTGNLLIMPKARRKLGCHTFAYAAPKLWNELPVNIRTTTSLVSFRSSLKTHLFKRAYA